MGSATAEAPSAATATVGGLPNGAGETQLAMPSPGMDHAKGPTPAQAVPVTAPGEMKIAANAVELIGNTPLVFLPKMSKGLGARIAAKLEYVNPGGSVKDRIAKSMIDAKEADGTISPEHTTLVELTSGNTGIGMAAIGAMKGYKCKVVMPDVYSIERRIVLMQLGCEVVLADHKKGIQGAFDKVDEVVAKTPGAFYLTQFENPNNPAAHFRGTGPEIMRDTSGQVDIFVCGSGTGGTITGVGRYLKSVKPGVKIVVVEPEESPLLSGGKPGPHQIEGMGPPIIPPILDMAVFDEIVQVNSADAMATSRQISREEGLLVGISSGAAMRAAMRLAAREENAGKLIVVIFASQGERYLSTELYKETRDRALALAVEEVYEPEPIRNLVVLSG